MIKYLQDETAESILEELRQRVAALEETFGQRMGDIEDDMKAFREVFDAHKEDVREHLENLTSQAQSSSSQIVITPQEGCVLIKGSYYDQTDIIDLVRVLKEQGVTPKR